MWRVELPRDDRADAFIARWANSEASERSNFQSFAGELCDRIMVMKSGEIVESGWTAEIFANPQHAYTQLLLDSIPRLDHKWVDQRSTN